MGLGFGLLSAQAAPGEKGWERAYEETLALAKEAERLGFDSLWTTEHHFVDDGYMPSLLVTSAAMAQATSEIELGTGVILAPLHHPLRLAEDAATVDLISGGRLILGLGLGWSQVEFEALGVDRSRRGAAMEEILQILPKAWEGDPFRFKGDLYDLPEVGVRPTPSRRIPIVIGGSAEPAIRRAARLGDGLFSNAPVEGLIEHLGWMRDELEGEERDLSDFRIIHYSVMLPGETEERALEEARDHLWQMSWKYGDMEESARRSGPPPRAPELGPGEEARFRARSVIAGSAGQIVERLQEIRSRAGVNVEFVARSFFSTMSLEQQSELMGRLAEDVAPHV